MAENTAETLGTPTDDQSLNFGLDDPVLDPNEPEHQLPNDPGEEPPVLEVPREAAPDIREDATSLQQDVNALEDIGYLLAEIRQAHGMSQTFALEAERICPGFLPVPVGYYTKTPSATRLQASLEGLYAKVWETIASAVRKLREQLVRFLYWLARKPYPGNADGADPEADLKAFVERQGALDAAMGQALQVTADQAQALANAVREGVQFQRSKASGGAAVGAFEPGANGDGEQTVQWSDLDRIIGELLGRDPGVEAFMLGKDPFFTDLTREGPYARLIRDAQVPVTEALSALKDKVGLLQITLQQALAHEGSDAGEVVSPQTRLSLLAPVTVSYQDKQIPIAELVSKLKAGKAALTEPEQVFPIAFEDVYHRLSEVFRRPLFKDLGELVENVGGGLLEISQNQSAIEAAVSEGGAAHAVQNDLDWSKVMMVLSQDFTALLQTVQCLDEHRDAMRLLFVHAMRLGQHLGGRFLDAMAPEQTNSAIRDIVESTQHGFVDALASVGHRSR